mmetsp:Transcript_20045/g.37661  ORF Transcript_20045/g.37661 Transcript_20045/m.37661 type:complete len:226 (-) Transcript_20045:7-684(-)
MLTTATYCSESTELRAHLKTTPCCRRCLFDVNDLVATAESLDYGAIFHAKYKLMLLVPFLTVLHRVFGPSRGHCRHLELCALVAVERDALPVVVRVRRSLQLYHPARALRTLLRLCDLPFVAVHGTELLAVAQCAARAAREHRPGGVIPHLVAVSLGARSQLIERIGAALCPALDRGGVEDRAVRARDEDVVASVAGPLESCLALHLAPAAEGQLATQLAPASLL